MSEPTFTIWTGTEFKTMSAKDFPKVKGWKSLFFIRHIRYFYNEYKLRRHIIKCIKLDLGWFPQESDLLHLQRIWEGRA